jgi:hypothetical protein
MLKNKCKIYMLKAKIILKLYNWKKNMQKVVKTIQCWPIIHKLIANMPLIFQVVTLICKVLQKENLNQLRIKFIICLMKNLWKYKKW